MELQLNYKLIIMQLNENLYESHFPPPDICDM
jgi:hypothetical protein